MLNRRAVLMTGVAALMAGGATMARAAETMAFTPQAFAAAQQAGDPILVEITAPWCPTCKAQKPILSRLEASSKFKTLKVFQVDFDSQKAAVRGFNARMQSTLIAFKGSQEVARSVGDTEAASIASLLDKSI